MKISYCFKHSLVTLCHLCRWIKELFLGESNEGQTCQAGYYIGSLLSWFSRADGWFRLGSDPAGGYMDHRVQDAKFKNFTFIQQDYH